MSKTRHPRRPAGEPTGKWRRPGHRYGDRPRRRRLPILDTAILESDDSDLTTDGDEIDLDLSELLGVGETSPEEPGEGSPS